MLSAEASALVAGGMRKPPARQPAAVRVRVLRPFMWAGAVQERDSSLELPPIIAAELVSAGKAERLSAAAAPAPAVKTSKAVKASAPATPPADPSADPAA